MSVGNTLGFGIPRLTIRDDAVIEQVIVRRPLQRVMAFLGYSIHDVCNDPIARNKVYGFFKLHKQIERSSEINELERAWNPTGAGL